MDEQYEDLEADGLEDDPVAKTYARDALEDVTSDDYSNPSERLGRLDAVGGLSSRILAGGETSDRWDEIYKRDAVAMPDRQEHGWEAAGSIAHNSFRSHSMDSLSKRMLGDDDGEGWTDQASSATPLRQEQGSTQKVRSRYHGPYHLNQKQVVISRWSNKVQMLTPNGSELKVSPVYLPPICVFTGKKLPPLGAVIDHQASPHAIHQKLVYVPRHRRYLWACVYIIVLVCSLAMAKAFLGEGVESVSTSENRIWSILKAGPESLISAKIMAGLGILLFLAAVYTFYSALSKRITCSITIGFSSGWPRYKRTSFFIVGSLFAVFGIAIFYLTYGVPFLWVLRNYANPGILVTTFGLWVCWSAWQPLKCVKIGDEFIRFEGGALLSGQLPKQLFAEMDRCPREVASRIRDDEELDRVAEENADEGLVAGLVKAAVPERLIFTAQESLERKLKRERQTQRKREREERLKEYWERLASKAEAADDSSVDEDDSSEFAEGEEVDAGLGDSSDSDSQAFDEAAATMIADRMFEEEIDALDRWAGGEVLTEEIARKYLQDEDGTPLWEYKSLDEAAAIVLAQSKKMLYLSITKLSPEAAAGLAIHRAPLVFSELAELSVGVAQELAKHQGGFLHLDGVTVLSEEVAEVLARYRGWLSFDGLTELAVGVADSLGRQQGRLSLNGLTSLSVEAAKKLLQTEEAIELNGLTKLSLELAETLAQHKGGLDLDGLTSLTLDVAQALAKTQGDLELDGLTELTLDVAKVLAKHEHRLTLDGVTEITLDVAQALSQGSCESISLLALEKIEGEAARILSENRLWIDVDKEKLPTAVYGIWNRGGH